MGFRKNVFILGAGFSAGAGAPLMANFLDRARQLWEDPRSALLPQERDNIFKSVFDYRFQLDYTKAKFEIDLDNIEDLFGLIEMQCQLAPSDADPIFTIRRNLLYLIVKTLDLSIVRQSNHHIQYTVRQGDQLVTHGHAGDLYDHFAKLVTRICLDETEWFGRICRESIITFNYDLILDHSLVELNIRPAYGLEERQEVVDERALPTRRRSMYLLKLHGSSNWMRCISCSRYIVVSAEKGTHEVGNVFARRCDRCQTQSLEPMIVPPTWNKGGHPIMQRVWQKALAELKEAQRIFILGYSVPPSDRFFDYLLSAALAENKHLYEIIIVNSDPDIVRRYQQIFSPSFWGRYVRFHEMKIEACISGTLLQKFMRHELVHDPSRLGL